MIFDLAEDFSDALAEMPDGHPKRQILRLMEEAIRRDMHFVDLYPTTLFQCLWNTCWWYDCSEAPHHYDPPKEGWLPDGPPWEAAGPKLFVEAEAWERLKETLTPGFPWFRSRRPPSVPLNGSRRSVRPIAPPPHALAAMPDRRLLVVVSLHDLVVLDPLAPEVERAFEISLRSPEGTLATTSDVRRPECVWLGNSRIATLDGETDRIRIWDVRSGTLLNELSLDIVSNSTETNIAWSGLTTLRSSQLLAASRVSPLQFTWNRDNTQAMPVRLEGPSAPHSMTSVWSTKTGRPIAVLRPGRACSAVSLSSNGNLLAIAWDRRVVVYYIGDSLEPDELLSEATALPLDIDLFDATSLFCCELHGAEVAAMRFMNDGRRLAIVEPYGGIELYDVFSGERLWRVQAGRSIFSKSEVADVTVAGDDSFVSSMWRKLVYLVNTSDGTVRSALPGARSDVENAVVVGGSACVAALTERELCVWEAANRAFPYFLKGTGDSGFAIFHPTTGHLVSECPNTIIWWDVATGRMVREEPRDMAKWLTEIVGTYDGKTVVINTSDKPPVSIPGIELIEGRFAQIDERVLLCNDSRSIGWLPRLRFFTSHPDGNLIAGSVGNDVCLYEFVDEAEWHIARMRAATQWLLA